MKSALEGHFDLPLNYTDVAGNSVKLEEISSPKMWQLEGVEDISQQVAALTGQTAPAVNQFCQQDDERLVWQGRQRYFWLTSDADVTDGNSIYATDQSQSKVQILVSGSNTRALLCRGLQVDISAQALPVNSAILTHINHIGVSIMRLPDTGGQPVFEVWVMRGFAVALMEFLSTTSATL